jgi:hypothetical protein
LQGERGWYMVNVQQLVRGDAREFPMFVMLRGAEAFRVQRDAAFQEYIRSLWSAATITDERWRYFKY